ncbi:conserved hypothetical protein [Hyella patelloides LEGE 07179]|uniref:Uncharacterized protein n=1 Tax=Hyella patelloides LEGE 07179 TaxID=945734 RepID=A0A563VXE2_9CYAN|nr:hypothetical protein [Hyella patelloides]VEP16091.1 conserved hypothetical protein [Hyella patelloides LEGE 07179]
MNSILAISPGNTRAFDMEIASALGDINSAVIVQQLHYWMQKEGVGTIIEGVKYVYNTFEKWVREQFQWLSIWQFRKSMNLLRQLEIVKVIRYKSQEWNQTNYYSLDYNRLREIIKPKSPETISNSDLWSSTDRDVNSPQIEVRDSKLSNRETKNTSQKETAKAEKSEKLKSASAISHSFAAAQLKTVLEEENQPKKEIHQKRELNGQKSENQAQLDNTEPKCAEEKNLGVCSINEVKKIKVVNPSGKSLVEELDSIGVPINKTLINLVKMYSEEEVKSAIALVKIRKREKHIPNLGGYFTAAVKGNWASSNHVVVENSEEIDTTSVFRLWYELARELGYCASQEIRDGEQWVLLSGSWEKWQSATKRGYSLDYLKSVMKRNKGT